MKKKALLTSIMTIALCFSLIAGATFALFTSESSVNIAITSGKVDVTASVEEAKLYRPQTIDINTFATTFATDEDGNEIGTDIETDGAKLSLGNLIPGDKVVVKLNINSKSTVSYQYRVSIDQVDGDNDFYENLIVGINGNYYSEYVSEWKLCDKDTTDDNSGSVIDAEVEIIMPAYLGNDYAEKNCNIAFKVEAVQGNANVSNDSAEKKVYPVYSQEELDSVLSEDLGDGATIVLMQKWNNVSFETESELNFNVKGCNLNDVTVNASNSTISYYVDMTEDLDVKAVASHSFYLYGKVNSLGINHGRLVVEETAEVEKVTVAPAEDQVAMLVIKENVVAKQIEVVSEGQVKIDCEGAIENLITMDNTNVEIVNGSSKIENVQGEVKDFYFVSNEAELTAAIANGGYIRLVADFETSKIIDVTKNTELDGDGHTIVSKATRILWINQSNVDVVLKDVKLLRNGNNAVERGVQVNLDIKGVNLTIDGCTVEASMYTVNICNGAEVDLTITNSEITGWGAINAWSAGYSIHVSDSILRGVNDKGYDKVGWNNFGTVVIEGDTTYKTDEAAESVDIELKNCRIIAESKTGNKQRCILFNSQSKGNRVNVIDCTFELENENCTKITNNGTDNNIIIYDSETKTAEVSGSDAFMLALSDERVENIIVLDSVQLENDETEDVE